MTESRAGLIVPLMKARVPVELQLEFPLPPGEDPIRETFVGGLYLTYAFELRDRLEHVTGRHCAELGVQPSGLRRLAATNLRTLRPELSLNWYPDVRAVSLTFGGDLEAGLVLDEGLLDKLEQDVDGELVVAIPARDVFIATGTGHPDGVARLRRAVDHVWSDGGWSDGADGASDEPMTGARSRLLTRDLLVRHQGIWALLPA